MTASLAGSSIWTPDAVSVLTFSIGAGSPVPVLWHQGRSTRPGFWADLGVNVQQAIDKMFCVLAMVHGRSGIRLIVHHHTVDDAGVQRPVEQCVVPRSVHKYAAPLALPTSV